MDTIETISPAHPELFGHTAPPSGWRTHIRRLVRTVRSLAAWIDSLLERRRSRMALLEMTDGQLKDIGISRCDAHREGLRRFWD